MLDRLERADRLAKGLAELGVLDGHFSIHPRGTQHLGTNENGGQIQQLFHDGPAFVERPDQVGLGDAHILEHDLRLTILGEGAQRDIRDASGLGVDEEQRKPGAFFRGGCGARGDQAQVGREEIVDEQLVAVEHKVVAVSLGRHLHGRRQVARVHFGERPGEDRLSFRHAGQDRLALLGGS